MNTPPKPACHSACGLAHSSRGNLVTQHPAAFAAKWELRRSGGQTGPVDGSTLALDGHKATTKTARHSLCLRFGHVWILSDNLFYFSPGPARHPVAAHVAPSFASSAYNSDMLRRKRVDFHALQFVYFHHLFYWHQFDQRQPEWYSWKMNSDTHAKNWRRFLLLLLRFSEQATFNRWSLKFVDATTSL